MALRDLLIKISADGLEVDRELQRSSRSIKRFGRDIQGVGQQLTLGLTLPLAAAGAGMLGVASSAQELGAKFTAVFRELTPAVESWAEETAAALGRSSTQLEAFLARLQDTFVPLGFARGVAAEYSKTLTSLALDVAAFNDMADEEVLRDFTSAIVGNQEAVRKYGIVLTQTSLKAELLRMGVASSVQAATEQEKVQARVNILLQGTADAQGTAAREATGFAAGQKSLVAALRDTAEVLGRDLLPLANQIQRALTQQIREFGDSSESARRWGLSLGIVAAALGPITTAVGVLTIAVATLSSTLAVGLLPIIGVAAPLLVGIGLVSAGFVKMRIDASNSAGTIDEFAKSLEGLDRQMLLHQQTVATLKLLETDDPLVMDQLILQGVAIGEALDKLGAPKDPPSTPTGPSPIQKVLDDLGHGLRTAQELSRLTEGAFRNLTGAGAESMRRLHDQGRAFRLAREEAELYAKAIRSLIEAGLTVDDAEVQALVRQRQDALLRSLPPTDQPVFGGIVLGPLKEIAEITEMVSHRTRYIIQQTSEWAFELSHLRDVGLDFTNAFASTLADAMTNGKEAFTRFRDLVLSGLAEILVKLALFRAVGAIFGPGSGVTSFVKDAFGFSEIAPGTLNLGLASSLAPRSFSAPVGAAAFRVDLSGLPPAKDPRQAARDRDWMVFWSETGRAVAAAGG